MPLRGPRDWSGCQAGSLTITTFAAAGGEGVIAKMTLVFINESLWLPVYSFPYLIATLEVYFPLAEISRVSDRFSDHSSRIVRSTAPLVRLPIHIYVRQKCEMLDNRIFLTTLTNSTDPWLGSQSSITPNSSVWRSTERNYCSVHPTDLALSGAKNNFFLKSDGDRNPC